MINGKAHRCRKESGLGKLSLLFFLVLGTAATWSAFKIIPFFYSYYELENQMASVIRVASTDTDREIRQKLMYHIKKLEIPMMSPDDLHIQRDDKRMKIWMPYEEVFYITWRGKDYDLHTFKFVARAEGAF